jgi:hypothetical protein
MANEFVARNGVIALNNSIISGSLFVSASTSTIAINTNGDIITSGSIFVSASYSSTAIRIIGDSTISGSLFVSGSLTVTGSINASRFTGSLFGTSSWAQNSLTASYFITSSVTSASYAATASNILGGATNYIPFFSGSISLSSSVLYQSASSIGIGTTTPSATFQVSGSSNVVNFRGSGSTITSSLFTVDGASGRLFSVNDSLSGSLFSVNTIAGLPVIEAFSDNTVRIGQFGQKALFISQSFVGVGIENPTVKLHISSSTGGVFEIDGAGSANTFYVSSSARIGIGTNTPVGKFDISYAGALNDPTILLGADDTATTTRTNNTTKLARIAVAHYNNSATSSTILAASSTATANTLFIGGGSAYMNSANSIQFYIGATTASLIGTEILRLSGSGQIIITGSTIITGSVNISGSTTTNRIIGNSVLPTIAVGTGAGTGPAGSVVGSDLAGAVRLRTGTTPAALAQIGTVTFSVPYISAPYVIFSAASTASAAISQSSGIYITSSTTGFTAFSNITALPASTQFTWSYAVFQ